MGAYGWLGLWVCLSWGDCGGGWVYLCTGGLRTWGVCGGVALVFLGWVGLIVLVFWCWFGFGCLREFVGRLVWFCGLTL